jgi:hypothetical protein
MPHFQNLFFSDKYTFILGSIHHRTMKLLKYVWTVFEKLLAFFEDPKLIDKGFMFFLVCEICGKMLISRKIL